MTTLHKLFLVGLLYLIASSILAQSRSDNDSLINVFEHSDDAKSRLMAGLGLCNQYLAVNPQVSLEYGERISQLISSMQSSGEIGDTVADQYRMHLLSIKAQVYGRFGDVAAQTDATLEMLEMAQRMGNKVPEIGAFEMLGLIYFNQDYTEESVAYYRKALAIAVEIGDTYYTAIELGNIGSVLEEVNLDSTLYYFRRSLSVMRKPDMSDREGAMGWMMENMGHVFQERGEIDSAFSYYYSSLALRKLIDHRQGQHYVMVSIARLFLEQNMPEKALAYADSSIRIGEENSFFSDLYTAYQTRSKILYKLGRYREAMDDHMRYVEQRDSIVNERNSKQLVQQSMRYEHRNKVLADSLEFAKKEAVFTERTEKQRIGLFSVSGILLLLFVLAFVIYKGKRRSDALLLNILPKETARELKEKGRADSKLIAEVTVMFTDFKNFTQASEQLSPSELVEEIHFCYSAFDRIVAKYKLEKIKTIGDAYMCAGGLPVPNTTNAADTLGAAIEIRDFIEQEKQKRKSEGKPFFEIRIGCHTGPVVAGIVGIKKFTYDIWGDTVNIASRMESSGEAGKINISGSTYGLVKDQFLCEHRGKVQAKNKGEIDMYFVEGRL